MTTYLAIGHEVFRSEWEPGKFNNLHRKRSHARLKAYASCEDIRAWSTNPETKRRHILSLVNSSRTGYGNYVPVLELVKVLGVPEAGLLLNDALKKLNELSSILGIKDHKHPALTESEMEFRQICHATGGDCKEEDTVRNLRCLVSELYERMKEMERLRCERDELRSTLDSQSSLESEASAHKLEATCLRMRVEQFEGIEKRMDNLMNKYDAALKELRDLRKCNTELMETNRLKGEEDMKEIVRLREEMYNMCKTIKKLEVENDSLNTEALELRCAVQDQEDEILRLTNYTDTLTRNADCKQEQMRYVLNEIQLELNDKVKELAAARVEMMESKQYIEELTELRNQMRRVIDALTDNKQYFRAAWDLERKRADQLEEESSMELLGLLTDPDIGCDVVETITTVTKETLNKLVKEAKELNEENRRLCCKLECYRKTIETKTEELQQAYVVIDQYREEIQNLKDEIDMLVPFKQYKIFAEDLQRKLTDSTDDNKCLTSTIDRMREEALSQLKAYNEIKAANIQLQEMASLGQKVFKMKEEMKLLKDRVKQIDEERRAALVAKNEGEKLKKDICTLKCNLTQCQEALKEAKSEVGGLTALVEDLEDENRDCNKRNIKLNKENNLMKEALNDLGERLAEKKDEWKKCECHSRGLKAKLQKALDDIEKLSTQLVDLEKCLEISEQAKTDAIKRIEEAEAEGAKRADELDEQIRSLKDIIKMTPSPAECDAKLCAAECKQHDAEAKTRELELKLIDAVSKVKWLEKELAEMEEQERISQTELSKCQQEIAKLYADIDDLYDSMRSQDNTLKEVCGTTEQCKDYINTLKTKVKQLELDKRGLTAELGACKNQKSSVCQKLKDCREDLSSLSVRYSALEREYDDCKKDLAACTDLTDCSKKEIRTLSAENTKLMSRLTQALAELDLLAEELKKEKQKVKDLEQIYGSIEEAKKQLAAGDKRHPGESTVSPAEEEALRAKFEAERKLEEALEEITLLNNAITDMQIKLDGLQVAYDNILEKLETEKQINAMLQAKLKHTNMELNKANMDLRSTTEELNKTKISLNMLEDELANKIAELNNLTSRKECLETELTNVRRIQNKDRDTITALRDQITELDRANADLKADIIQFSNDNVTLTNLVSTLTFELTECRGKILQMESNIRNLLGLAKELNYCNVQVQSMQSMIENLEAQWKGEKEQVKHCKAEMQEVNTKWEDAERKVVDIEKSLISEQSDKKAIIAQLNKTKKHLTKAVKEYERARDANLALMNDVANMKNKVAELEFRLAEKDSASDDDKIIANQASEIQDLKKKNEELSMVKNGLEFQISQNKIETDGAKAIAERMKSEVGALVLENNEMKESLSKCQYACEDLERRTNLAENAIDLLTRDNGTLRSNLDITSQQNDTLESTVTSLTEDINNMKHQEKDLRAALNKALGMEKVYLNKIENQKTTIKDLNISRLRLERHLSTAEDDIVKLKGVVEAMKKNLMTLTSAKNEMENDIVSKDRELKMLESEVNRAQQALADCNVRFASINTDKQLLEKEARQLRESTNMGLDKISDLQIQLSDQQSKCTGLLLEKNDIQASLERCNFELSHTMKDLAVTQDLLSKTSEEHRDKTEQLANCRRLQNMTMDDLNTCKKQCDDLASDNSNLKIQARELERKLTKTEEQLTDCEDTNSKLALENDTLSRTVAKVTAQFESCLSENSSLEKEIQFLFTRINTLLMDIKALKEDMGGLKEENDSLKKEKESLERMKNSVQDQLSLLQKQMDGKVEEVKTLTKRLQDMEDELTMLKSLLTARDDLIKTLKEDNVKLKKEIQHLVHDKAGLEKIKFGLENEIHTAKNNLKLANYNLESVKKKLDDVLQEKMKLNAEMVSKKAQITGLNDAVNKIRDTLSKAQDLQTQLERKVREIDEARTEALNNLQNEKRITEMATATIATLENSLKEETADRREKIAEINRLQGQAKQMEKKLKEDEFEILDLKQEAGVLKSEITNLTSAVRNLKMGAPADTNLNKILQKVIAAGWDVCDLAELGEVHAAVVAATDALVCSGKAKPVASAPVVAVDPKPTSMPQEKKQYLLMLAPLHRQLLENEEKARKRTCALNATVEKYQHELYALRHWDLEMSKKLDEVHGMSKEQCELLRKQSCYQQSRISHYLDVTCKEKQMADSYDCALRQALGKVNATQRAVITNQMEQHQAQVTECLRSKLSESEEKSRRLACDLAQERQKTACLQMCATKPRQLEPLPPFTPQKQQLLDPVPQIPPTVPPRLTCTNKSYPTTTTFQQQQQQPQQPQGQQQKPDDCPCKAKVSFCDKVETRYFDKESR